MVRLGVQLGMTQIEAAALNRERILIEGARRLQRIITRQAAEIHRLNNREEA